MNITFDPTKNATNIHLRGLSFERVIDFDWATANIKQDERKSYPEPRFEAIGFIDERLFVVIYCNIANGIRVISFRKANLREVKNYVLNY